MKVALGIQGSGNTMKNYNITKEINRRIFRAYDIRGIVDKDINEDIYYTIGLALGVELHAKKKSSVALGYDARLSSKSLSDALAQGLLSSGINVISVGQVPSPVLYFALGHLQIDSGVMVTGSHNPKDYNGIKMVVDLKSLADSEIMTLYERILNNQFSCPSGAATYKELDIVADYIEAICSQVQLARPLKVAIDCGNGVAGGFASRLFSSIGAEVIELFCEVDGRFPNHHPDPSVEENLVDLIKVVKQENCDLGLAFDGDADRLGFITNSGDIIWPDRQLIFLLKDILKRNPGASIVFDVKCSSLVEDAIKEFGGKPHMCPTGHSYVKKMMREKEALLAGEMSGHIFIKEQWSGFDDALYSAARLLKIIAESDGTSQQQFNKIPDRFNTPEIKIPVSEEKKFGFMQTFIENWNSEQGESIFIDGLRYQSDDSWGLIRASNTSPYLVARFESSSQLGLEGMMQFFRQKLLEHDNSLKIPF